MEWEYDGVDLGSLAWDVRWLGAKLSTPPRRGDNLVLPGRDGRVWLSKPLEQRVQSLVLWVKDCDPNSGGAGSEAQLLANLDALRGLFSRAGQHALRHTMGGETRAALAEVASTVEFEPQGLDVYYFAVDFLLADPLWYAEELTSAGPVVISQDDQAIQIMNPGSHRSTTAVITITGPLGDPVLTIGSAWLRYEGAIGAGSALMIDCRAFTALLDGVDVSANITHGGEPCWLAIPAGASTLVVAAGRPDDMAVTQTVAVDWWPAYV